MEQFVVSARKYRPQTFKDVVGQKAITSTLLNAIETNHLAGQKSPMQSERHRTTDQTHASNHDRTEDGLEFRLWNHEETRGER